jgi:hypothetical protein
VSLHGWWRRLPQPLKNGWRQIDQACNSIDTLTAKTIAGKFEDQGYVDRSVVKKNTVGQFAMVSQGFAVIGCDYDQRIVMQIWLRK